MIDWLTGRDVGWTRKMSFSRTLSRMRDEDVLVRELEDLGLTGLAAEPVRDLARQLGVGVAVVDLVLVYVHALPPGRRRRSRRATLRRPAGPAPSGWGSSLSPMPPRSASPSRNAAIATTLSPSASRMTITPRALDE